METTPTFSQKAYDLAVAEAQLGLSEGGIPIGSTLAREDEIIGQGHNRRVQQGDTIAHGEMDCLRNAGRQKSYAGLTLYTTLSPCMMCSGTIVQFGIKKVVIAENKTFGGNEDFLRSHGVEVVVVNDPNCEKMMQDFIDNNHDLWFEDIGEEVE